MPVLLQQLLSKQITTKLPDVPTEGALSADQIERQFLQGASAGVSTENQSSVKITGNYASGYQENEENGALLASMNNLSISASNASSDIKNVEKHHPKNKNERGDASGDNSQVVCLTKDQLLVALKYLLKDDGFVTRLHCAYLESINTRLGLHE
ncbi:unnamed protein product [Litomosoides sigmodontis]|uniref:mRNA-decapping enzyme C-terminal domain-containing protein n=1 Tax=Litomosoides sigmodontis TaxID=42156 RepID=A0A3P7KDR1_LITSI|nr:unnamed protein product [Litomosoides sigmodontis]